MARRVNAASELGELPASTRRLLNRLVDETRQRNQAAAARQQMLGGGRRRRTFHTADYFARAYYQDLENAEPVEKALQYAAWKHLNRKRKDKRAYYVTHPAMVARWMMVLQRPLEAVQAAFVHDVLEDTPTPLSEIEQHFGHRVAEIVSLVSKPKLKLFGGKLKWVWAGESEYNSRRPDFVDVFKRLLSKRRRLPKHFRDILAGCSVPQGLDFLKEIAARKDYRLTSADLQCIYRARYETHNTRLMDSNDTDAISLSFFDKKHNRMNLGRHISPAERRRNRLNYETFVAFAKKKLQQDRKKLFGTLEMPSGLSGVFHSKIPLRQLFMETPTIIPALEGSAVIALHPDEPDALHVCVPNNTRLSREFMKRYGGQLSGTRWQALGSHTFYKLKKPDGEKSVGAWMRKIERRLRRQYAAK